MQVTAAAKAWIRTASTEDLKRKLAEYAPKEGLKPRDVEYYSLLRSALSAEISFRENVS